jgi:hypothetical protein
MHPTKSEIANLKSAIPPRRVSPGESISRPATETQGPTTQLFLNSLRGGEWTPNRALCKRPLTNLRF